jgi:tetratricopeptide (TPR) repeat protein
MVAFGLHWMACRATAAGRELRAVAEHARNAGDMGLRSRALGQYIMTLMYGSESAEAVARQLAEIEAEDLGPFLAAHLELGRAELQRLQGNLPETRRLAHRAIDGFGSLGMGVIVGGLEQHLGHMELMAGQAAAAIDPLLRSDEILANLGERDHRSTTQAMLAEAYEELGQLDKARAAIALSDELGAADDVANLTITHRIRARIALSDGDAVAAAEWAQSAVNHASQTDFPLFQAQTRLELARILAAINQPQAAVVETHSAIELFEAKGDHPGAAEARALLATNIQSTPEHSAPEH